LTVIILAGCSSKSKNVQEEAKVPVSVAEVQLGQIEQTIVYNGDILTDLPLAPAIAAHRDSDNLVTLVLRSDGAARHIACP
jgi:NDP-sugar pyrophosphorylase family protein